ncbi:MAG: hypothetical protein PHT02_14845, partial [Tissierellia bacterium]|nr:hypothetical protein [Tissierellia bacterium]
QQSTFDDDSLYMLKHELMSNVGELYGLELSGEAYLVADDVMEQNFYINPENNEVIYVNEENNLYKVLNEEKIKIASNIRPNSFTDTENNKYFFIDNESEALYTITENNEKEKIAEPDTGKFAISQDRSTVAFTKNNELYVRRLAEDDKIKISNDVDIFYLSPKGNIIIYRRIGRGHYIRDLRNENEEVYKLSNNDVLSCQVDLNEENIFLLKYNSKSNELCYVDENFEIQTVADEINRFYLDSNGKFVVYLNDDDNLFYYDIAKKESEKIGTDINYFQLDKNGNTVVYSNNDKGLYSYVNGKEPVKIADDVLNYNISNENIFYFTYDNVLFYKQTDKESEKISDDVKNYCISSNGKDVAYIKEDSIYIKIKDKDSVKAIEKASDYKKIFYSNSLLFEKTLQLNDLAGFWMHETDPEIAFIDIKDNKDNKGKFSYFSRYTPLKDIEMEVIESGENYININTSAEYSFDEIQVQLIDNDSIYLNNVIFNKIDKTKFDDVAFSKEDVIGEWYYNDVSGGNLYSFTMTDSQIIYNIFYYSYGIGEEHNYVFDYEIKDYGMQYANLDLNLVKYSISGQEMDINEYKNDINSLDIFYESSDNTLDILDLQFNGNLLYIGNRSYWRIKDGNLSDIRKDFIKSMIEEEYLYNYYYVTTEGIKAYESSSESSAYLGTLSIYSEYYIEDLIYDENGDLWLKSYTYDSYSWDYINFWFKLPEQDIDKFSTGV